jgi:organic hydroperoxide reductase OsmC/OhrA
MKGQHRYSVTIRWTGNEGTGTTGYRDYARSHTVSVANKPDILSSSDPSFRGDKTMYNPEELLVAALSSCHMLWYLHLCSEAGITVTAYKDLATGIMKENAEGGGHFTEVTLHPVVTVTESSMVTMATELHKRANTLCFIANSVNFVVRHEAKCLLARQ